jgi:superfamily I DNA/RNA helicase
MWEQQDSEAADALLANIALPRAASYADLCTVLGPIAAHAPVAHAISRMDRIRRVCGQANFTSAQVTELVHEAVRNQSRLGFRQHQGHLAMTIQRAKNREFQNVIVLWPHTATGSPEHLRRLLYNAITRAISHCSVIVLGQGRLNAPPFAPPSSANA